VVDVEEEPVAADEPDVGAGIGVGVGAAQHDAAVRAGLDDQVGQVLGEDVVAGYPHLLHHGSDERWVSDTFSSLSLIPQCEGTGT